MAGHRQGRGPAGAPPPLVVVCGPTASGKTRLGVALARALNGEVVSADSMQIYRGMDIGTAKPTPAERKGVAHHMLDVADPAERYSVARYVRQAGACVDEILAKGKRPILVGGTGLYIDSLVAGRTFPAFAGRERALLRARLKQEGIGPLFRELSEIDPETAARLHPNDERRILRGLEVWRETGKTVTQHNAETRAAPPRYRAATLVLGFPNREDLWARIDRRVDEMMALGLAEEVRGLLRGGLPEGSTALQAIGYKELVGALRGEMDLIQAAEEIKLRTRQYAKRQETWFRRNQGARRLNWDASMDFSRILHDSTSYLAEAGVG